jgi:hypothetical protein
MPKFYEGFADEVIVPAGKRDVQVFDDELPGFGIRKFSSGQVRYFVKYNVGSQQRRHALGAVVRGNLRDMRLAASKILAKARLGIDAVAEKRAAAEKHVVSLNEIVTRYLEIGSRTSGRVTTLRLDGNSKKTGSPCIRSRSPVRPGNLSSVLSMISQQNGAKSLRIGPGRP